MTNDAELVEAATDRTGLSTAQLATSIALDDRRLRRVLSGELPLPDSARLLVQLLAARPWLLPELDRIRAGLPDEEPATLKPCPFCGGPALDVGQVALPGQVSRFAVRCAMGAGCATVFERTQGKAHAKWNRRDLSGSVEWMFPKDGL